MEFTAMLQKDLMILARERNIKGRSNMRKADLVKALHQDELGRKEGREIGKEERKEAKSERKAELKETRKERKRAAKEEKEMKEMRTVAEIKRNKKAKVLQRRANDGKEKRMVRCSAARAVGVHPAIKPKSKRPKGREKRSQDDREVDFTLRPGQRLTKHQRFAGPSGPRRKSTGEPAVFTPEVIQTRSSLKGFARQYVYEGFDGVGPREFLEMHEKPITDILETNLETKVKNILKCSMEKRDLKTGEIVEKEAVFQSKVEVNLEGLDKEAFLQRAFDKIMEDMASFTSSGSGWRFKRVIVLEVHLADYVPLRGNSFIPLPDSLKSKKAIINMKNEDDECFKWCITRALNPVEKDPQRITRELRRQSGELDWSKTTFPVEISRIGSFEASNEGIIVNVYGYDEDPKRGVYPLRISPAYTCGAGRPAARALDRSSRVIDLLLIEEEGVKHYCLIKNFSRLLSSQVSKDKRSKAFCRRCLNHFPNDEKLGIHDEYCKENECVRLMLPSTKDDGSAPVLKFKNFARKMKVTDAVYADFEAFTEKISSCQPDPRRSFTHQYQKHEPCGFGYHFVCFDESVYSQDPVIYRMTEEDVSRAHSEGLGTGHFVAQKFVDMLEENIKGSTRSVTPRRR